MIKAYKQMKQEKGSRTIEEKKALRSALLLIAYVILIKSNCLLLMSYVSLPMSISQASYT